MVGRLYRSAGKRRVDQEAGIAALAEIEKPNRTPWSDLVAAAQFQVERIQRGDANAAVDAIRIATVGLRSVLAGRPLDPEQSILVRWLEQSLAKVTPGHVDANRALGLVSAHAPFVPEERDAVLCLWVHEELQRPRYRKLAKPLPSAFEAVAKRAAKKAMRCTKGSRSRSRRRRLMAKRNSKSAKGQNGELHQLRPLDSDDVINVLTFLSWQQPLQGVAPSREHHDSIECGRMLILDWMANSIRISNAEVAHG
jgi:hypothetical protein